MSDADDSLVEFGESPDDYRRAHRPPRRGVLPALIALVRGGPRRPAPVNPHERLLADVRQIVDELRTEAEGDPDGAWWKYVTLLEAAIRRARP